jgi:hypothetical protein
MGRIRFVAVATWLLGVAATMSPASAGQASDAGDPGLAVFRTWLSESRPGYGCDEGPAPFRNETVEAAYPGLRFYYVLTYTRGIQPPFPNSVSLVATVDDEGRVNPFRPGSPSSYGRGLMAIHSKKDVKLAAAAVSIVASCGERRWKYTPELFDVKKKSQGWIATYHHGSDYSSWVRFDKKGAVIELGGSAPPVP